MKKKAKKGSAKASGASAGKKKTVKKPWGGRFKEKTARSVEKFTESVSFDHRLAMYDIEGSMAHARMLGRQGIIPKGDAAKILKGLKAIASDIERGKFRFRESLEDVHMNIEAELIKRIGPSGGRLHTARSRNDQVALDLRLYLRAETDDILGLLESVETAILKQAEKHLKTVMPGYTHMQRAQPVLLAHHLLAYVEMFERDRQRFTEARKRINVLPLGSGAMAGTSLKIDRKSVAKELGFASVSGNSMDSVSDRDFALEFCFNAGLIMAHLSRLSEELVLWNSEEFSFISLPDAYATGSSIMPQKKNPDVPELARGKVGRVYGNLMNLLTVIKGLPMTYNRDLQEDKPPVFDTADTVKGALGVFSDMLPKLKFNSKRMAAEASSAYSTATDVAEYLVGRGMPFRDAHEVTGRIVAHAMAEGKQLEEMTLSEFRKFSGMFKPDVLKRLSAEASVNSRNSEGGTSPRQVASQLKRIKAKLKI
jgi:argininosuccinate lyase